MGGPARLQVRGIAAVAAVALALAGCHGSSDARSYACALVRYWGDQTGTVSDPDSGPTTRSEVVDLGNSAWPYDIATADLFLGLYDHLSTNESDADYSANEADPFLAAHCRGGREVSDRGFR
jgi:hypothetical protein